jgi:hypothetical protein
MDLHFRTFKTSLIAEIDIFVTEANGDQDGFPVGEREVDVR